MPLGKVVVMQHGIYMAIKSRCKVEFKVCQGSSDLLAAVAEKCWTGFYPHSIFRNRLKVLIHAARGKFSRLENLRRERNFDQFSFGLTSQLPLVDELCSSGQFESCSKKVFSQFNIKSACSNKFQKKKKKLLVWNYPTVDRSLCNISTVATPPPDLKMFVNRE